METQDKKYLPDDTDAVQCSTPIWIGALNILKLNLSADSNMVGVRRTKDAVLV